MFSVPSSAFQYRRFPVHRTFREPAAGLQVFEPSSFVTQSWSVARPSVRVGSVKGGSKLPSVSAAPPRLAARAAGERLASNAVRSFLVGGRSGHSGWLSAAGGGAPAAGGAAGGTARPPPPRWHPPPPG